MSIEDLDRELEKTHVIYLHETVRQSLGRDVGTASTFLLLWSFGHYMGSAALEWVGVVLAGFIIVNRFIRFMKRATANKMTPDQAREWLDEKFPLGQPQ